MKQSLQFSAAIVGVIVGAGFASGQEIVQFFTFFGLKGTFGSILATVLFAIIFMRIVQLGSMLQTTSHQKVLYHICGKYIGIVVDFIITFFLFGVLVVMFAGSGSLFEQQFGLPNYVGNIFMAIITILTVCLNIQKIISIMGAFTPILFVMILLIGGYSVATMDYNFAELKELSNVKSAAASNWVLGSLLYVSYVTAAGFAMLTVMGGTSKEMKSSRNGGIMGGIALGLLILLFHFAMISKFGSIQNVDMPSLLLADHLSPWVAIIMTVLILGMIYNTAVGMLYSFTVRFFKADNRNFKKYIIGIGIIAFLASFAGFTNLVGTLYPITGYLGFVLIAAILWSFVKTKNLKQTQEAHTEDEKESVSL
ncbi:YkvI family membrane protein [Bacillus massiliigorillae]|uniref:YkvI family membrane protein n=1 Tax=Bacillus massiliigorillae TaxID=1243664 RepID=UPI000399FA43|nr:membrane protein [Bacillus massiliigorillae]